MKILAAYKYVVGCAARTQASSDGTGAVSEDFKLLFNPADEAASNEVSNAAPVGALSVSRLAPSQRHLIPSKQASSEHYRLQNATETVANRRYIGSKENFEINHKSVSELEAAV